tara:strand:- start:178 stop:411 length:234 start_codon:yes stop_codon:yes gene_type:complete
MEAITRSMNNVNIDTDVDKLTRNMNNCTLNPRPRKNFKPKVENGNPYNRPPSNPQKPVEILFTNEQLEMIRNLRGFK